MKSEYQISDSELEVMKMLWQQKESIKQSQLLQLFENEGKEWKRQTLNTFLSRLEGKGLIKREKGMVSVVCDEEEYSFAQVKSAIDNLYGGKLSNFMAAFIKKEAVSKEDAEELNQYLKTLEVKQK